jgi:hypothetical protein
MHIVKGAARALWWTSQELSPTVIIIIIMDLHAHESPGGEQYAVGGRSSETQSHPTIINPSINQSINRGLLTNTVAILRKLE